MKNGRIIVSCSTIDQLNMAAGFHSPTNTTSAHNHVLHCYLMNLIVNLLYYRGEKACLRD